MSMVLVFLLIFIPAISSESRLYGPGLKASFQAPVRYFYLESRDREGRKFNSSTQSADQIEFHLTHASTRLSVHAYRKVDDLQGGTYLFRYRLYESVEDLHIFIRFGKEDIARIVKGHLYSDGCYCPEKNLTEWYTSMECSSLTLQSQISNDLKIFEKINMREVMEKAKQKFFQHPKTYALCHYVIKNNQIYRTCYGEHVDFKMFSDAIFLSLSRKVVLPDVEFLMNLGDYPLSSGDDPLPILSWCGSDQTHDIVLPTYEITESTLQMLSRTSFDIFTIMATKHKPWSKKIPKGFFRGRDSNRERLDLVRLAKKHPNLLDANLTRMFFFRDQLSEFEPLGEYVPMPKFFDYKYQISLDGTVASYRFPYLLAGDGLILKQSSPYYEHFYRNLLPNKHYISIKRDLSDLIEQIQWANEHDNEVQHIIKRAQRFTQQNLLPNHILCYHIQVLHEYAKHLISPIEILPQMELVQHDTNESHIKLDKCPCHRLKNISHTEL